MSRHSQHHRALAGRNLAFGLAAGLALALLGPFALASQPQFWKIEGARDFLEGETEGLSVDSDGRVRLAPAQHLLHDTEAPFVWCLARSPKGILYAGTGNDGKIYRIEAGKGTLFYDAAELEVHALAVGPNGKLYAATSPDGKVYAIDATGKAEAFYDPGDKYIWALAFDPTGHLFVATGSEGRIHRVDDKGKAQVVLTSPETHILSLAIDTKGNVLAGSSPSGIVYRLDPSLKVFVLHDSPYREVKALDTGTDGSVYAALVDGKERDEPARPAPPLPQAPTAPSAEVTVTESFGLFPTGATAPVAPFPAVRTSEATPRASTAKGAVIRILPSGEVDTLWSSSEETPHAIVRGEDGVIVGTGNKGKLYRVKNDRSWSMVSGFPAEQVTGLTRGAAGEVFLATSNPGKVYGLDAMAGARGTFTSKVKDTDTVSVWGRVRWDAIVPAGTEAQVQTRSGNTATPDSTWTEWSTPYARQDGDAVTSERARFLQLRSVLTAKAAASPVLDTVSVAYLQRNLRPQIQSVTVHAAGEVFQKPLSITGEIEILGLEPGQAPDRGPTAAALRQAPPAATTYSRKLYQRGIQTFSWKADDPNGDGLVYDIHYRLAGESSFRMLRKGLTEAVLAWDTTTLPNGRYAVRVTASDAPGNPEGLALTSEKESSVFDIDNTPPVVTATIQDRNPLRLRAVVRDESSLIRKAEYSVDGGRWQEVYPMDGINDSLEETYDIAPGALSPGVHVLVVRASDLLGNVSTGRVEIKP